MKRVKQIFGLVIISVLCLAQTSCIKDFSGTTIFANLRANVAGLTGANEHLDVWVTIHGAVFRIGRWLLKKQEVDLPGQLVFEEIQVQSLDFVDHVVREKGSLTKCSKDADCTEANEVCSDNLQEKLCKIQETQYLKIGVLDQQGPRLILIGGIEFRIVYNLKDATDVFFTVEPNNSISDVPTGPVVLVGKFADGPGRGVKKADIFRAGFEGQENFNVGKVTLVVAEDNVHFL